MTPTPPAPTLSPVPPRGSAPATLRRPRSRRTVRRTSAITMNIAPMIDTTFMMLIFFVATRTFVPPEGVLTSRLPRDAGRPAVALPISPITVRISSAGPGDDAFALKIDNFTGIPKTFEELAQMLREIQSKPGFDADTPVVIVAAQDVSWDHVVNVWNAAVRCQYRNIAFSR